MSTTTEEHKCAVYTKTGDQGTTSLYNGSRRTKDDQIFEALGDVDELNANLGIILALSNQPRFVKFSKGHQMRERPKELVSSKEELEQMLVEIQSRLLDLGSCIATPIDESRSSSKLARVEFSEEHITKLEKWMDEADKQLPKLLNFILPGGGLIASRLHVARCVCRRAERKVVTLINEGQVPSVVMIYLNRLSDFLFVAARFSCLYDGHDEVVYVKSK